MRKLLVLLTMMVFFPLVSNAQLNVVGQVEEIKEADTIASSRFGVVKLKVDGDLYYLRMETTNRFDEPMLFVLGETPESALATLQDLHKVATTLKKKTHLRVKNNCTTEYTISREAMNTLWFMARGYAGIGSITSAELAMFMDKLAESRWN